LVAVADSMRSQKELTNTIPHLTGFALVAYMLSSFGQRPSDWTHLAPLKDKLKEFSCPTSSLLFVPGLFKMTENKQHWYCTVRIPRMISDVYGEKLARRVVGEETITESIDSVAPLTSSVFPAIAPSERFAHLKFDSRFYSPLISESGCLLLQGVWPIICLCCSVYATFVKRTCFQG
jgi:hypothetical protein